MHFFFVDDARQNSPTRPGMGPLIAIGGFHLLDSEVKKLNKEIDSICSNYGFPSNEPFKWSPGRELWVWNNLIGEKRINFYIDVLTAAENTFRDNEVKPEPG